MSLLQEQHNVGNGHREQGSFPTAAIDAPTAPSSKLVLRLALLVGVLGAIAAGVGLLWQGSGESFSITTFRGQTAEIYGRGLYQNDTLFNVGSNRGSDIVMLFMGVPLLAVSGFLYARGSFRGRLVLLGTLGFFLYISATYALGGVAYNEMFLVYVALFASSLFALVATFLTFDLNTVTQAFSVDMPRQLAGRFLIASGVVTLGIWLIDPLASLLSGEPPKGLETHSTLFTHTLDMAVIVPGTVLAGAMILRRHVFGYVVAFSLLILEALLFPLMALATVVQLDLGVAFEPPEIVGPIVGFTVLAVFSLWVIAAILRGVPSSSETRMEVTP